MISATQQWVEKVIVKYNICPFARKEVQRNSIRYVLSEKDDIESTLIKLLDECHYLSEHDDTETTLLILANGFQSFDRFLDIVDLSNQLLYQEELEGVYQIASFHPDYCFAGEAQNDPANYTNRSPYPCLHIIRESTMEKALSEHPDPDAIPQRNIEFSRNKGSDFFIKLLAACTKHANTK